MNQPTQPTDLEVAMNTVPQCPVAVGDVVRYFSDSDEVVVADPAPRWVEHRTIAGLAGWVVTLERLVDGQRRTVRADGLEVVR